MTVTPAGTDGYTWDGIAAQRGRGEACVWRPGARPVELACEDAAIAQGGGFAHGSAWCCAHRRGGGTGRKAKALDEAGAVGLLR
jgi:hypothetical protein